MRELSMTQSAVLDQYFRCKESAEVYRKEIEHNCVSGYLSRKKISGHVYWYLQWREGKKVCSKYVSKKDLDGVRNSIALRKQYEDSISKLEKSINDAKRFLGKDIIYEYEFGARKEFS